MHRRYRSTLFAAAMSFCAMSAAEAAPILGLFSTGVDNAGVALGDGAIDTHYAIVTPTQSAVVINQASIPGSWFPNSATSRWVWENSNGQPINVTRTFETEFDLTGLDHTTASISGSWATDNLGLDILINGSSTANTCAGFTVLCSFTISSGFTAGLNTLSFQVEDAGVIAGLLVAEISGTANAVPEPSMLALLGLGLAGLGFATRRRVR